MGTIWGYSTTPNVKVNQLLSSEVTNSSTERVTDIAEILLANEGKRIRIFDNYNTTKIYEGTYEIVSPYRKFSYGITAENINRPSFELGLITITLKTENGILLLPANSVGRIEILDSQPNLSKPKSEKQIRLGIKTEGAKDGQKIILGVAALERGIRWIPAYRVEVKGDPIKEAKLELEANVINDLADLNNSEINFVVGVPHFLFQDTASPLSINTAFTGVSSNFRRDERSGNRYSNAISSQVMSDVSMDGVDASPTVLEEEKTTAFSAEQLFLYQTNQLNLKKGERATMRLFSLTVPCTEVFEWTINDVNDAHARYLNSNYSGQNQQINSLQDLTTKIWYALKLKNTTGMPWTTAPAISFREWKPLGQDLLKFTTIGGEEVLRVTPATEVVGTHTLEEKERVRQKLRWNGSDYDFDLVTVVGTIKLRNVKKQPVELVLTRNLVGEVTLASDGGKITKDGLNLQSVNSNSVVKWNVTVPNGEKELKYTYNVFVRK
ncbi:MAG TPA: hypothetical protein VK612_07625 [Pyrinomonadaceae bacterium]|nr:hypothetical protein [Pyrinomonadaceae bacterium]